MNSTFIITAVVQTWRAVSISKQFARRIRLKLKYPTEQWMDLHVWRRSGSWTKSFHRWRRVVQVKFLWKEAKGCESWHSFKTTIDEGRSLRCLLGDTVKLLGETSGDPNCYQVYNRMPVYVSAWYLMCSIYRSFGYRYYRCTTGTIITILP